MKRRAQHRLFDILSQWEVAYHPHAARARSRLSCLELWGVHCALTWLACCMHLNSPCPRGCDVSASSRGSRGEFNGLCAVYPSFRVNNVCGSSPEITPITGAHSASLACCFPSKAFCDFFFIYISNFNFSITLLRLSVGERETVWLQCVKVGEKVKIKRIRET